MGLLGRLRNLQRKEPQRASQIGEWTGLTPGSVTALLNRLEDRGFLIRIRPDHNRRSLEVFLTPEGRALGDAVIDGLLPTMNRIAGEVGPEGCRIAVAVLGKINAALDSLAADPRLNLPDLGPLGPTGEAEQQDAFRNVELGCNGRGVVHWSDAI